MRPNRFRNFFVGLAMLAAVGLAAALTPNQKMADQGPAVDLEAIIPSQFGDWRQEQAIDSLVLSPQVQSLMGKIYNQILTRNYINEKGRRIMLSITYGGTQNTEMQVHRPEMCYPAQGFMLGAVTKDVIDIDGSKLPVMKLVASQGLRVEPIMYWVMIGESAVRGGLDQSLARVKYGLTRTIPYGILIRVSTISPNDAESYELEEEFIRAMLRAMTPESRQLLAGAG
ncbi:MAG: exosortase-associated protein EpsI, B-type [Gammaproteobacteria bacterium]